METNFNSEFEDARISQVGTIEETISKRRLSKIKMLMNRKRAIYALKKVFKCT